MFAMCPQIRFREVAPKLVQLLTEWTETFPYDFRDERMMRCLKDMTHLVARGDEVQACPRPASFSRTHFLSLLTNAAC